MSRIRILMTIPDLSGGGAEREFATLAQRLSRERFEPHLLLHRPVYAYPVPPDLPLHLIRRTRPWHTPGAIRAIRRVVDEVAPALVFSQLHYANMLTGSALARSPRRPRWVCRQTNDPERDMRGPFAIWARRALARADRVLGCCDGVSRALVTHLHLAPNRVETLVNAVDTGDVIRRSREPLPIEHDPERFTVIHAGRLSPQKNQRLLIEAFARLPEKNAVLWILGEGPLRRTLAEHARARGVSDRVHWLGFQDNPYPFFRAADCFALSSDHEGLPNAVIEANLCGTPAVATRCRYGPDELIEDGVTGRLCVVGDATGFADALARMARERDAARHMGEVARERAARRFDTDTVCARYEALFQQVAAES
jgi:glycosyltransferase involved in cell wall biosynthesis